MKKTNDSSEFREVSQELLGWEKNQVIATIKGLTFRPGKVVALYAGGKKNHFISPVIYFFGSYYC